jgi:hypothetical protein
MEIDSDTSSEKEKKEEKSEKEKKVEKEWRKELNGKTVSKIFKETEGTKRLKVYLAKKNYKYIFSKDNMVMVVIKLLIEEGKGVRDELDSDEE